MKKICFCTTIPLTIRAFILKTAEYLHMHTDWDISFICSYDEAFAESLPDYIHYYPVDMKRGVSFDGVKVIRQMEEIFKRERFDLVQYSTPNAAFYASVAAKRAGVSVRNYHLMGLRYLGLSGVFKSFFKRLEIKACKNSTDIECVSRSNLELGVSEGLFPRDKAVVVWNGSTGGVDLERFDVNKRELWRDEFRSELGLDKDDFIFGFVGRITADKGINELLEAFLELKNGSKLLLTGFMSESGSVDSRLLEKAKSCSDILFHESMDDIERCYAALDVLILPSYREGFGNVVIEAAAVGTPAIVSEIPGPIDAIKKDVTAFTVNPKSSESLLDAMKRIYESDHKKMGEDASEFVRKSFDSKILNQKNLERKRFLLERIDENR